MRGWGLTMKFTNCLRIQIVPNHHEEQRIQSIADFCVRNNFSNVMLFINAEEYNVGHMTISEAQLWVDTMKKAATVFRSRGLTVSLNPWIEWGHLDRCRQLKEGQNFVTQVDYDGNECSMVACPLDKNWLEFYLNFAQYLIEQISPDVYWIEDDFRFHNHGDLHYGGCFCAHHMHMFNSQLDTNYTREQFVDKLFGEQPDEAVKKAFLDVNRKAITDVARAIGERIKSVNSKTIVGLMSSRHNMHAVEARDWSGVHNALSQGGMLLNRLHLPGYFEEAPKRYYYSFNYYTFLCRGLLPKETQIMPEIENAAFSLFSKDAQYVRFEVESALPLQISGMTYDIFDFVGNGVNEKYGYGEAIAEINNYLDAVTNSEYRFDKLSGITFPMDEKACYNRKFKKGDFMSILPTDYHLCATLAAMGISPRTTTSKEFGGELVVLSGDNTDNFTDAQLVELFKNNHVIVDGRAVNNLVERKLGKLVGVSSCVFVKAESDLVSFEALCSDILVDDVPGYRATAFDKAGDRYYIQYECGANVLSKLCDNLGNFVANGSVEVNGHYVTPYVFDDLYVEQFNPLRYTLITNYIKKCSSKSVAISAREGIYAYLSEVGDEHAVLILVNATLDTTKNTTFWINKQISGIKEIKRDGTTAKVEFASSDGNIAIDECFSALTTKTFILEF